MWGCISSTQGEWSHTDPHQEPHTWVSSWSPACLSPAFQSLSAQKMLAFPEFCHLWDSYSCFEQDGSLLFQESRTGWDMSDQKDKKTTTKKPHRLQKSKFPSRDKNKIVWNPFGQCGRRRKINNEDKEGARETRRKQRGKKIVTLFFQFPRTVIRIGQTTQPIKFQTSTEENQASSMC